MSDAGTRRGSASLAALLVAATALLLAPGAMAKTIDVRPQGPAVNVIQMAVNKAHPGDRIRVHQGTYRGSVRVDKKLSIFGARGERRPKLDARCRDSVVVEVGVRGVSLSGLKVVGSADAFTVNFTNIASGRVDDLKLVNTCGQALYGVNVYGKGAIRITNNDARGYLDAGYYVGSIGSTGERALVIKDNTASGNNRGAIVEDSSGVDIRVIDNVFDHNTIGGEGIPSGIFVHNSDGMLFSGNVTRDNGVYGIHVDPESDDNLIRDNESSGNGTDNFFDEGTGNCGSGNSFPIPAC